MFVRFLFLVVGISNFNLPRQVVTKDFYFYFLFFILNLECFYLIPGPIFLVPYNTCTIVLASQH